MKTRNQSSLMGKLCVQIFYLKWVPCFLIFFSTFGKITVEGFVNQLIKKNLALCAPLTLLACGSFLSAENLCKQFGPRSGLTECWVGPGPKVIKKIHAQLN